jgi:ubiquinone/menaquinone biosynthesis C-methylase UbiE
MKHEPAGAGGSTFNLVNVKRLFSELRLKEDSIFLDVGCGGGSYSIAASEYIGQGGRIYAVDLWKEGIDSLQKEIRDRQINNIVASVADVSKHIPVADQSIDVCLMATVLHDLIKDKTDGGTLREIRRVLKPHGQLAIIEFHKIEGTPGPPLRIRISAEEVERHLHRYDFRMVKTMDIGTYHYLSIFTN